MTRFAIRLFLGAFVAGLAAPAGAAEGMKMPMPMSDTPAHFKVARAVYTTDHRYLVKLLSLPSPIPYQSYFSVRLAVYQGRAPHRKLDDAKVGIYAGMRHGMKHGFAHGMDSAPKLATEDGVVTVSGMYFHMMGPWVLKVSVDQGGKPSTAYFRLPCCGK
ncbi:MAG TPA: hypothetical protein VLX30_15845 [Burkholderiales bacterium]|nr:hypothetical protein [Burkholderiales bacterium]